MAATKTDSRSQTARARARQAMADELERARKRESKLVAVFSAIDARADAEAALGDALIELKDLGVAQSDLAEMTGLSARRFRIPERGVLREGAHADVVVFDPARVRDRASFEDPIQFSEGIEHVFVNGVLSYTETGRGTNARAGRFVRRG